MMERGRWQTPQQKRKKKVFLLFFMLNLASLCIPISLSSISLCKKLFLLLLLLLVSVCVCCVGPASVGMRNAPSSPPGGLFLPCLRVRMCLLDASILCPIPGQGALTCLFPTSSTRKSRKKKKKGKKFLRFFLFFFYHLWCGCPLPSRGYIAPPCAPCRYQTAFLSFFFFFLPSISIDKI